MGQCGGNSNVKQVNEFGAEVGRGGSCNEKQVNGVNYLYEWNAR